MLESFTKTALAASLMLAACNVTVRADSCGGGQSPPAHFACFYVACGGPPCPPNFCNFDGVTWDNIIVRLLPGFVPDTYNIGATDRFCYTQWLYVDLAADGSYGIRGGVSGGAPNVVDTTWGVYGTNGGPATVEADAVFMAGCVAGPAESRHATVIVTIGPLPASDENQTKQCDLKTGCPTCSGGPMANYSIHLMLASLHIEDTPISYSSPRGPSIDFKVVYNQREANQPTTFPFSNLGPKWTFNWLSYVTDDGPGAASVNPSVYVRAGGTETYSGFNTSTQSYAANEQTLAVLVRTSSSTYEKRFPGGAKEVFSVSDGSTSYPRRVFLSSVVDAAGNATTLTYDTIFRITTISDSLGQPTTLTYGLTADQWKITKVTDPFLRFATFEYTSGQLTKIIDPVGIESVFGYASGSDFINSMTTPYGTSIFAKGEASNSIRWLEATDPLGGKERVEYNGWALNVPPSEPSAPPGVYNSDLQFQNTFYWDKKAMADAPGDYSKAQLFHWLSTADGKVSGIKASDKKALENRVWYTYQDQTDPAKVGKNALPIQVARLVEGGATQLSQYNYNTLGNLLRETDPAGRVKTHAYDTNDIDVLRIYQRNPSGASADPDGQPADKIAVYTYNSLHEPLTDTDAAGQVTTYTYNTSGQILTRTNAKNETTTYAYGGGSVPAGYLASITSPPFNNVSAVTSFSYDSFNRVHTVTDMDNYTVTTDYDNVDRKTQVTYPDATYEQFQYTDNITGAMTLDLTGSRDRLGRWTYRHYNANRRMDSITDPLSRTTLYGWCTCGALESITDPKNQTTMFNRDLQGRVYQKVFADATSINYLFEGQTAPNTVGATSRLKSSTDAKNQRTNYLYFADDTVQQMSYTDTAGQPLTPPTPSVNYTYDPNYKRVASMIDGIGTTIYAYNSITVPPALGAGRLASSDAPLANDTITFGYDELGRVTNRSINGTANSDTWNFDSLGRVNSEVNKLGTLTNTYVGVTNRLSKIAFPGGASANYLYFPNAQDKRLQQIKNLNNGSGLNPLISQFDYTYDAEGEITTWKKSNPSLSTAQRFDLGYDNAEQLLTAPLKNATTNALIKQYTYGYDLASNRTSELVGTVTTASTPNNVNELTSQTGGVNRTLTYDLNGSITNDGSIRTFEWDGANRLAAINYTGATTRSEFSYDGLSRVAKIVEKTGSTVNSTRKFVWSGTEKCEFRDATDAVTLRFYAQGQYGTTASFYTRDHLGSIQEMFSGGGTVVLARYDYDPYGRSTSKIPGTPPDFNFTGLYRHSKSNLDLATYRAYDPDLGRWLSRDPIGEDGGLNLYAYVGNNPLNRVDFLGLRAYICRRPLGGTPGTPDQRTGPDVPGNPLYHQYYCVESNGQLTCYGQGPSGPIFWSHGEPTHDTYDPHNCEEIPSSSCIDKCLSRKGSEARPQYGFCGPGTNCQEWSNANIATCRRECSCDSK